MYRPPSLQCLNTLLLVDSCQVIHGDGIRDVKLEYKTLKEKVKEYNKKDAKFYGNMFAKMKN